MQFVVGFGKAVKYGFSAVTQPVDCLFGVSNNQQSEPGIVICCVRVQWPGRCVASIVTAAGTGCAMAETTHIGRITTLIVL
jgi:hypothetical protein